MKTVKCRLLGYCHGVAETINKATQCIDRAELEHLPCYSIGKLIHNDNVVAEFEKKGLSVIKSPEGCNPGVALIRAHGIKDSLRRDFQVAGFELVDSTCRNILESQESIRSAFRRGLEIIVLGAAGHAETVTLLGTEFNKELIPMHHISETEDALKLCRALPEDTKVSVFTQTTFEQGKYDEIMNILEKHFSALEIGSRLCPICISRKKSVEELCGKCNAVVVVGGNQSHNTRDLERYVRCMSEYVVAVENVDSFSDETDDNLKKYDCVGVCSGTSVPESIIEEVVAHLEAL